MKKGVEWDFITDMYTIQNILESHGAYYFELPWVWIGLFDKNFDIISILSKILKLGMRY